MVIIIENEIVQFKKKVLQMTEHIKSGLWSFFLWLRRLNQFNSNQIKHKNDQHYAIWDIAKMYKISKSRISLVILVTLMGSFNIKKKFTRLDNHLPLVT